MYSVSELLDFLILMLGHIYAPQSLGTLSFQESRIKRYKYGTVVYSSPRIIGCKSLSVSDGLSAEKIHCGIVNGQVS